MNGPFCETPEMVPDRITSSLQGSVLSLGWGGVSRLDSVELGATGAGFSLEHADINRHTTSDEHTQKNLLNGLMNIYPP